MKSYSFLFILLLHFSRLLQAGDLSAKIAKINNLEGKTLILKTKLSLDLKRGYLEHIAYDLSIENQKLNEPKFTLTKNSSYRFPNKSTFKFIQATSGIYDIPSTSITLQPIITNFRIQTVRKLDGDNGVVLVLDGEKIFSSIEFYMNEETLEFFFDRLFEIKDDSLATDGNLATLAAQTEDGKNIQIDDLSGPKAYLKLLAAFQKINNGKPYDPNCNY